MRREMKMKNYMRSLVILTALLLGATSEVWAQAITANDIFIQVMPSGKEGKGSVTDATYGRVFVTNVEALAGSGDERHYPVTLTVTPASGYRTKTALITAEKMIDPSSLAPRRAPRTGTLPVISASGDDWTTEATTYTIKIPYDYHGAYVTVTFVSTTSTATQITTLSELQAINSNPSGSYILTHDIDASRLTTSLEAFSGTLDGNFHKIYNLSVPLFSSVSGGTVKNVTFEDVNINVTSGNAGTVTALATGSARIYNCGILPSSTDYDNEGNITGFSGSSVSGSGNVGGFVGTLSGTARVINCYSYANITGGTTVGGIVGNNTVTTTSASLNTMVMNCMFYGEVSGSSIAPIYNGEIITNAGNNGVGNYNYFWAGASYVNNIDNYHCALMAETRFLQRFEFYRHLLNSHLELAGWWATDTYGKSEMAKWVLEPSQIGSNVPFPILKTPGKYPSVVNYEPSDEAIDENNEHRNEGRKLTNMGGTDTDAGKLTVTIQMGNGAVYNHPGTGDNEAKITTASLKLTITDKDPAHFNFNYGKVQLPYYNDVGTKNYTDYRVVTGWKIVSITGGTAGSYSTGENVTYTEDGELDKTPYNFADRNCTNKDLYGTGGSNRVFNQGAYWDVPEGVTAITIEPYWAKCVYLADAYADVVYNTAMTSPTNVPNVGGGQKYTNRNSYSIAGESQKVFTNMGDAIATTNSGLFQGVTGSPSSQTVYDYAVVLVGNYHFYGNLSGDTSKPYTVTSVDLDHDNEPDYSYILRFDSRQKLHPVRVDFLNVPGLGMAQKSTGSSGSYNFGIMLPKDWFEVTNTALFRVTQMEYEQTGRGAKPLILHGGVIEQWVSAQSQGIDNNTTYIHVGSNVWFKEFHLGCHQDKSNIATKHPPVSVTGGDYGEFYLTGLYATTTNYNDNAECYINGGRFGKVAGTGTEGIGHASNHTNGNIFWQIQNADIEEFYGGGTNAAKPIEGSITTVITGSHVKRFCGGPKFGDMNPNRTVITTATNCTFGSFFGAGYGGNSYYRAAPGNFATATDPWDTFNVDWNEWIAGTTKGKSVNNGNYANGNTYGGYDQTYNSSFGGVSTRFDYQFLPQSGNDGNVARLFIDFVSFSLATTHNVTSTLTGCTITGNFYGGGSLGKVDGTVTSTLTDCTVRGSVFGGGYDATRPTVQVMSNGFITPPRYDTNTGVFIPAAEPYNTSTEYTWEHRATVNSTATAINTDNHILYTTKDLNTLGQVTGKVTLNILGNTLVEGLAVDYEGNPTSGERGGVFGGGDASAALGDTEVNINTPTTKTEGGYNVYNVFGGGNNATVGGNTTVNLKKGVIQNNVFGGGNEGAVGGSAEVIMEN